MIAMTFGSTFEIGADPKSVQRIAPPSKLERFEGIGVSASGNIVGILQMSLLKTILSSKRKRRMPQRVDLRCGICHTTEFVWYPTHDSVGPGSLACVGLTSTRQNCPHFSYI